MLRVSGIVVVVVILIIVALAPVGAARAAVIYTDPSAWESALAGRTLSSPALPTVAAVPTAGATIQGNGIAVTFPANHGGMWTGGDGWRGDVHGGFGDPTFNLVTFDAPIDAFGGTFSVGFLSGGVPQAIFLRFGDGGDGDAGATSHKLDGYNGYHPGFFGWIASPGDAPVSQIRITGVDTTFYDASNVRFANLPEPAGTAIAAAASAALLTGALTRRRRSLRRHRR